MQNKIKCGVIGAGWWATFAHIPALLAHPDAELVAIQNDNRLEAQRIAHDFRIPHACTSVRELLEIRDVEEVVVSSSPNLHYDDALAAFKSGKHVLIEKPMTHTVAEARELVKTADEQGVQFLISFPWHHTAHAVEAQRLIRHGELGLIRMISVLMTNPIDGLLRGQFVMSGESSAAVHTLLPFASHVHVRGGAPKRLQTSVDENTIDFAGMLAGLQRTGFDGFLPLEYVWIDWNGCNRTDNVSETILLRDALQSAISGLKAA